MMATPISQISGLPKLLKASAMALPGLSLVTPVIATSIMAMMDIAPIGIALPIMAAITPTNIANKCQACGETPSGIGIINQMIKPNASAMAEGMGLNPIF